MNHDLIKRLAIKTDTRIFHLVIDGLGGLPHPDTGKTELETAHTPTLDRLAREGAQGLSIAVDYGITPGSGPAHLSLFGYDPLTYEIGRGILDISGVDFEFEKGDVAARVNFCTVDENGVITDRRAGRIDDEEGRRICKKLQDAVHLEGIETHIIHTKEYRAGIVLRKLAGGGLSGNVRDTDPQKAGEKPLQAVARDEESRETAALLNQLVGQARETLKEEPRANMLLVRGIDHYTPLPSFRELYKLTPLCVAVYPMYRGVSRLVGMHLGALPISATLDDQLRLLKKEWAADEPINYDYVFFHVKKTDSAGEDGNFDAKVHVLEDLDRRLEEILTLKPDVVIVTGDHSTPSLMKSHSWHPLPTLFWGKNVRRDATQGYGESEAARGNLGHFSAQEIMPLALANAGKLLKFGA